MNRAHPYISKKYTLVLAWAAVFVLGGMFFYSRMVSASVPVFNLETHEGLVNAEVFWKGEVGRAGGKKAYAEFLHAYASSTPQDQHTVAHIFGGSLYAQAGLPGLSVCDNSFSYGCFHEFLARAIEKEGLGIVATLNQACFDTLGPGKSLSCAHGLGHGIQSYLGYTEDALHKSLEICKSLPHGDPIGGCPGGIFMEFNMRTIGSSEGMPVRSVEPGGLQYPCNSLHLSDRPMCYYWQTQWWRQIFKSQGKGTDETFKLMGALCRNLPSAYHVKCFDGIGTVVGISVNYDAKEAVAVCIETSPIESEKNECLVTAASSFFGEPTVRNQAPDLCVALSEPWYTECIRSASGRSEIPPPARE